MQALKLMDRNSKFGKTGAALDTPRRAEVQPPVVEPPRAQTPRAEVKSEDVKLPSINRDGGAKDWRSKYKSAREAQKFSAPIPGCRGCGAR